MKTKSGSRRSKAQNMASRRRRRRRTYRLSIPLSLRLRRTRDDRTERKSGSQKRAQSVGASMSRALASALAVTMVALLVWFYVDMRFYVFDVQVAGTVVADAQEVVRASGLEGYSAFHVEADAISDRIRSRFPGIERAHVQCQLPNRVVIRVQEGDAQFAWESQGTVFLTDSQGHVLQISDETRKGLITIRDMDNGAVQVGDTLEVTALDTAEQLHGLLPDIWSFEYSHDMGVSLHDVRGWHIHFGDAEALPAKVASMNALLQEIARKGETVRLIDLRFAGSPYYE